MAGPNIQPPNVNAPLAQEVDGVVNLTQEYAQFFHILQSITFYSTRSGPTASRPTSSSEARWIGQPFFDTSLGKPVFLKIASSNTWVDGSGAVV